MTRSMATPALSVKSNSRQASMWSRTRSGGSHRNGTATTSASWPPARRACSRPSQWASAPPRTNGTWTVAITMRTVRAPQPPDALRRLAADDGEVRGGEALLDEVDERVPRGDALRRLRVPVVVGVAQDFHLDEPPVPGQ